VSGPAPLDGYSTAVRRETERVLDACPGTHAELLRYQHGLEQEEVAGARAPSTLVAPALCLLTAGALGGPREQALAAATAVYLIDAIMEVVDEQPVQVLSTAILRENIEEHPDILEHVARDLVIRVSLAHAGLLDAR